MAKRQRGGNSYKNQYKSYEAENRWRKNKTRRLEARLIKNPEDIGAKIALDKLKEGVIKYSRNRKSSGHVVKEPPLMLIKSVLPPPISNAADQLYILGLLNEKRYKTFKSRMEGLRRR